MPPWFGRIRSVERFHDSVAAPGPITGARHPGAEKPFMLYAMLLAHLVGDFVLQWNYLARWKAAAPSGVLVHSAIVWAVTQFAALLVEPAWWPWALAIGVAHGVIDGANYALQRHSAAARRLGAWQRFVIDQTLHLLSIGLILQWGGVLHLGPALRGGADWLAANPWLVLGYVFLTMPAWVVIEMLGTGLVCGAAPDFGRTDDKYLGMLERGLMTTLVLVGQLPLALFVVLPRLLLESPQIRRQDSIPVYATKLMMSMAIAILVGLALARPT